MFNLDGSEGDMCGNGIRCIAKYLYDNRIVEKRKMCIETKSGVKNLEVFTKNGIVSSVMVDMGPAELKPEKIPVNLFGDSVIAKLVTIAEKEYEITCVSMGNPHVVVFTDNVDTLNLDEIGPLFEHSELFPDRVNAEFVESADRNYIKMRVWERGIGETQACGTGACAGAVASVLNHHCDKDTSIRVSLLGGELQIRYTDETVYMSGDCVKVFEGVVEI
jgi:carbamoyl-phosphate synthase large subunit